MTPVMSEQHCIEQSHFIDINFYYLVDHKVHHSRVDRSQDDALQIIYIL